MIYLLPSLHKVRVKVIGAIISIGINLIFSIAKFHFPVVVLQINLALMLYEIFIFVFFYNNNAFQGHTL